MNPENAGQKANWKSRFSRADSLPPLDEADQNLACELDALAQAAHPSQEFVSQLKRDLGQQAVRRVARPALRFPGLHWPGPAANLRARLILGAQLAGMAALLILLSLSPRLLPQEPVQRQQVIQPTQQENTPAAIFPAGSDFLILAGPDGQVYRMDLETGQRTNLSDPGLYGPVEAGSRSHPNLSPDRQTLALPTHDQGTWLLSMEESQPRKIANGGLQTTWSPDSRQLAFISAENPQAVFLLDRDQDAGSASEIARLDGKIFSLVWSPAGEWIAAGIAGEEETGAPNSQPLSLAVALIDPISGETRVMAQFPNPYLSEDPFDLILTADGKEIWYLPLMAAIPVDGSGLRPLAANPAAGKNVGIQLSQTFENLPGPASDIYSTASPDGASTATGYKTSLETGEMEVVAVQTASDPAQHLWSRRFPPFKRLMWTEEGRSLILANSQDILGEVWRVDAVSGEPERLGDQIYVLGTGWALDMNRQSVIQPAELAHYPEPGPSENWTRHEKIGTWLTLSAPQGWHVAGSKHADLPMVELMNVEFLGTGMEAASLGEDGLAASFYRVPLDSMAPELREALHRIVGGTDPQWEPLEINGMKAYRFIDVKLGSDPVTIFLPTEKYLIEIMKYPAVSEYDGVFMQILDSLEIEP